VPFQERRQIGAHGGAVVLFDFGDCRSSISRSPLRRLIFAGVGVVTPIGHGMCLGLGFERTVIHGGHWCLRNPTRRGETFPAGEAQYRSIAEVSQVALHRGIVDV